MDVAAACPVGADNVFGPRIEESCRSFDFTLLLEDGIFIALPACLFLLLIPARLYVLFGSPKKLTSLKLASFKLALLIVLFSLHLAYLVVLTHTPILHTRLSLTSGVLSTIAILSACLLSFLEDQRSVCPSGVLVVYLSTSALLALPRLRSLWLLSSVTAPRVLWTAAFIFTVLGTIVESIHKTKLLRPPYKQLTKEQRTGFWGQSLFIWVLPFFSTGYSKTLELNDVPKPDTALEAKDTLERLEKAWAKTSGRHRLLRATLSAYLWPFLSAIIPRLALSCFSFCQPFLIEASVSNIQQGAQGDRSRYGHALVGAFILISRAWYQRQKYRLLARIRSGLIAKIYQDTTTLRQAEVKDSAAITLMSTNVEKIMSSLRQIHEIWASVPEIGVAIWLLARQMSYASVLPLVICLVSIVGASRIAGHFGPAQMAWIQRVRIRVAVTSRMIGDMKAVKMLGLTDTLFDLVWKLRRAELQASEKFRKLLVWQILTGNAPVLLAPFATFVTYAIIAKVKNDETLLTSQAFASLSLISLTTNPLIEFCEALPTCMQAIACFSNIEKYFLKKREQDGENKSTPLAKLARDEQEMTHLPSTMAPSKLVLFSFKEADIAWTADDSDTVLHNLTLDISPGFTAIIGPVASGKSTLLASMIGEAVTRNGWSTSGLSAVGFCSQVPWAFDDTVRQNITGDLHFDQEWHPILILDDVFSGLDSRTTRVVLDRLFGENGHFRKQGYSVIVATHSRSVLPYMDNVVQLDDGRIAACGPYDKLQLDSADIFETITENVEMGSESEKALSKTRSDCEISKQQNERSNSTIGEDEKERRSGSWSVYAYYAKSAGAWSLLSWGICTLLAAVSATYTTLWIEKWTEANGGSPNQQTGLYLGVYAMLVIVSIAGTAGECWAFFVNIINDTAIGLHGNLLEAPFEFFQKTDVGSITNRFSQDMDLIDMSLPIHAIQFTTGTASCVVQLVVICIVGKYLAAALPILAGSLFIVQKFYLRTSRQVRLMDIEAKAPIYKLFIETIQGVSTIRAFGWTSAFNQRLSDALNQSQKPFYILYCIQQWLALVLDLTVGGLAVVIIASATAATNTVTAGALGVALVLVLQFSSLLAQSIQAWTRLETSIGAVARVQQYVKEVPAELAGSGPLPLEWPSSGAVCFQEVDASYGHQSQPVLRNINLTIAPGEKTIICGQSGSGKSSLIMATLLMMEIRRGQIRIDDVDITAIGGKALRPLLNVVPQEPFFLPGSLRLNLDPGKHCSDDDIETALCRVSLWSRVNSGSGLNGDLDESEYSHGEKQLLCLARAMLVSSPVLILDEAMSSVDEKTEVMMQEIIDSHFEGRTVISIMHRFNHVNSYDRVVVMHNGEIIEDGGPERLLASDTAFSKLYHARQHGE
ncbi:hypothetical protein ED733_000129 [Metarhizium rileyi]|uniref:ABC transporter, transmembrane domain, type 1 n=1 Tax=Metarhizium rileyi (strain RCEF 4871) TaxID=1649241 RepID=A0A5C6G473_METRR|nr:hypothetical protein ED733_000129 [Metarhizium rileyi]